MTPRRRSLAVELAALALLAAAPWLPSMAVPWVAALALGVWLWQVEAPRERRAGAVLFGFAVALLFAAALLDLRSRSRPAPGAAELEGAYRTWLADLAEDAGEAAAAVDPLAAEDGLGRVFASLGRRAARQRSERTYLLLDADREAEAWSGRGLLHDLDPDALPERGFAFRQSATSATVLAVAPLPTVRGWRLVAGESRRRDGAAPLAGAFGAGLRGGGWRLRGGPPGEPPALDWVEAPRRRAPSTAPLRAWAGLATALGLLTLAALRGAGHALLAGTVMPRRHPPATVVGLAATAVAVAAAARAARPEVAALLAVAAVLAGAAGWRATAGRRLAGGWSAAVLVGPALALAASAWAGSAPSLTAEIVGAAEAVALRLALALLTFAASIAWWRVGAGRRWVWGWLAAAAVLGATLAMDQPALALPLLAIAGLAAASSPRPGPATLGTLATHALLAAMLTAAAWSTGERWAERQAAGRVAVTLLPPTPPRLGRLAVEIRDAMAAAGRTPLDTGDLTEAEDLAFDLWRRSPLARRDALSALAVEVDGRLSTFSFGLPLDGGGYLDERPTRWVNLLPATWPEQRIEGGLVLPATSGDAVVRWWLVPRLGFGAAPAAAGDLASGLLRGTAELKRPFGFDPSARWAVWDADGLRRGSAWEEGTPRLADLPAGDRASGRVRTPDGIAHVAVRRETRGAAAVLLPGLGPGPALERAGAFAAGALLPLALLAALVLAAALPRSSVRDRVRYALRSYSKRLLMVYAALLLVPAGLLYVLLSQTLERRIEREQEHAARGALRSAQRVLGELISTSEPGFAIETTIDAPFIEYLSRVTEHEVNLYWDSQLSVSSKRDLFAAGLLPRRLPGEVWVRLAYEGDSLARRTTRAGEAEYLELYAPLEVPGQRVGETSLVLSMPLLAQQQEAVVEAARLRRRTLLITLALLLVLGATGNRLARRFTQPIEMIVAGTKRIAAGAPELGFRPEESELEALTDAIDRMAGRIAQAREHLLAEKRLVERIVDSVTAGVVGLDAQGRVLLANRVARELLGLEPGDRLAERLRERAELRPVAEFVAAAPAGAPAHTTLRFGDLPETGREWTLVHAPLADAGDAAAILVVEDVTEVLRAQRLEAWAAMARIIAHEIKNPLTPIRLSAEHLREAWTRDREHFESVFDRCASNILDQVEELRQIASEFSLFSQIPRIELQEGDLVAAVRTVVAGYLAAPPPGVELRFAAPAGELRSRFDPKLLPRAVRNLLENAVRASAGGGVVEVRVERRDHAAQIVVADRGPGVPAELLPRILEPYFSTHAAGTGLGLPIAAKVAEEHGGSLEARNRASGGFEVVVTIPLT